MQDNVDRIKSITSDKKQFVSLAPGNRRELFALDKSFRENIENFNSKQIRAIKEQLYTSNIIINQNETGDDTFILRGKTGSTL